MSLNYQKTTVKTTVHVMARSADVGSEVVVFSDAGNDVELFGMKRSKADTELQPPGIECVRAWWWWCWRCWQCWRWWWVVWVGWVGWVGGWVGWLVGFTSFALGARSLGLPLHSLNVFLTISFLRTVSSRVVSRVHQF